MMVHHAAVLSDPGIINFVSDDTLQRAPLDVDSQNSVKLNSYHP